MKVACIGEAMVELALSADGKNAQVGFAGDTLNTAIYLKRSAPELDVSFVTRVGEDEFSQQLQNFIADHDVSTSSIETSQNRRVGLYAISTDDVGERSFSYWRDTSAAREVFQRGSQTDFTALEGFDVLFFSAISLAILPQDVRSDFFDWIANYRANGGKVAFDSNYRPALWENQQVAQLNITKAWEVCDIALPSVDDEAAIFGDENQSKTIQRLQECGVADGAMKCGETGPVSLAEPIKAQYENASIVVDTTAAGDSFNGGYLAAVLTGKTQSEALLAGHNLARKVIGHKGAIIPR